MAAQMMAISSFESGTTCEDHEINQQVRLVVGLPLGKFIEVYLAKSKRQLGGDTIIPPRGK